MPRLRSRDLLSASLGLLLLAGLAGERLATLAKAAPTDFDDAFMYLRYAGNLLAGWGVAWNPGEAPVFGVASLLHLAVVTALRWFLPGLTPAGLLGVASGAAATGLLAALVAIAAVHSRHRRLRRNWIFWTAVVLSLVAYREAFVFHAGTGMDTMLSGLANALLVFATLRLGESSRPATVVAATLAALLAVLARPDNALCAVSCPFLALALLAPRPRGRLLALFGALVACGLALLVLVEGLALGSPLPLAFFAKQPWYYGGFAGEFSWNPFLFLLVFARSAWPFVVALVLFADGPGWRRAAVLLLPALASIAVLFRFNQIMGHLGRFYYPFLPFFVAAGALEFDAWLARGQAVRLRPMLVRAGWAASVLLIGYFSLSLAGSAYASHANEQRLVPPGGLHLPASQSLPEMDSWQAAQAVAAIAVAAPPGSTFAMSEHGLPGALAPQVAIVDPLGLHDPYFAHHGFSAAELFRRAPDLIWLPHEDHTQMLHDILGAEDFWAHYDFYPDAFFHGIALRRDGKHHDRLAALLAIEWRRSYPGCAMADFRAARDGW
ncbi:MAG: hypothetical protein JXP73_10835 [Deltaproteobacteria bacterium]|nr:hypothetical protein [Deltaproteobacteria bacterium]